MQKYSSEDTRKIRTPKRKTSCSCICFRHTWGFSAVTFVRTQCERNVALWHWKIHLFLLFLYKHRFFHGFMKMSLMEYESSQTVTTTLKIFRLWLYLLNVTLTDSVWLLACKDKWIPFKRTKLRIIKKLRKDSQFCLQKFVEKHETKDIF